MVARVRLGILVFFLLLVSTRFTTALGNCNPSYCAGQNASHNSQWVWCGEYEEECDFDFCVNQPGSGLNCCQAFYLCCLGGDHPRRGDQAIVDPCWGH